jgi:uncharacterized membrane protein YhdT
LLLNLVILLVAFGWPAAFPIGFLIGQIRYAAVRWAVVVLVITLPATWLLSERRAADASPEAGFALGFALTLLGIPIVFWIVLTILGIVTGGAKRRGAKVISFPFPFRGSI